MIQRLRARQAVKRSCVVSGGGIGKAKIVPSLRVLRIEFRRQLQRRQSGLGAVGLVQREPTANAWRNGAEFPSQLTARRKHPIAVGKSPRFMWKIPRWSSPAG